MCAGLHMYFENGGRHPRFRHYVKEQAKSLCESPMADRRSCPLYFEQIKEVAAGAAG